MNLLTITVTVLDGKVFSIQSDLKSSHVGRPIEDYEKEANELGYSLFFVISGKSEKEKEVRIYCQKVFEVELN